MHKRNIMHIPTLKIDGWGRTHLQGLSHIKSLSLIPNNPLIYSFLFVFFVFFDFCIWLLQIYRIWECCAFWHQPASLCWDTTIQNAYCCNLIRFEFFYYLFVLKYLQKCNVFSSCTGWRKNRHFFLNHDVVTYFKEKITFIVLNRIHTKLYSWTK